MKYRKILLVMIFVFMTNAGVWSQGYPVMDITNILAAVQNGYTMVEQLQAMYTNLKTSYDQLQQQIKSFESFDFNQLDAKDPLGSWRSINTYANRMMTYGDNIEAIINKKDIKIGNGSYSLHDIFTTPPNKTIQNMAMDGLNFAIFDPFEKMLSPEEKAAFHRQYGMAYGHYMRLNEMGERLKKKAVEVIGFSTNLQQNLEEDRERLDAIIGDVFESESAIQQQQINNAVMSIMAQDIKTLANTMWDIAEQLSVYFAQIQMMKEAMQEELNTNDLDFSEGFLKMLGEMAPSNAYR